MEDVKLPPNCVGVNSLSLPNLKRKRSDSCLVDAPATTKLCTAVSTEEAIAQASQPSPPPSIPPSTSTDSVASPVATDTTATAVAPAHPPAQAAGRTANVDHVRDTVTGQLSLEILLKHNELRLIDQEIAKCQVALEQLRRCAEIPYPGSNVAGISADVSAGTGASLLTPENGSAPMSPAPWGVTDGPYSRHYARWLLPDPRFDGVEVDSALPATPMDNPQTEGRSTRGNPMDFNALAGNTRPQRSSHPSKLQSLPTGYPPAKEKPDAILIRRKSDQVLVKLVCPACNREKFSSTQGFINHCRIAHSISYASHEQAAQESGQPVQVDKHGDVIGDPAAPAAPAAEPTPARVSTPGRVHPLNRNPDITTPWGSLTPWKRDGYKPNAAMPTPPATGVRPSGQRRQTEPAQAHPSFMASPATPHLSALMRRRGLGLDMSSLVEEAKTPVDLSGLSGPVDDELAGDEQTPSAAYVQDIVSSHNCGSRPVRQPMRMPVAQAPESRKGLQLEDMTPTRPSHHQPYLPDLSSLSDHSQPSLMDTTRDTLDFSANLSPNTIESNQAPSLVSDYEDDYGPASDSENSSSSEADEDEEEFRHIEVQDDERATAPSAPAPESKPSASLKSSMPQTSAPLPMKQGRSNLPAIPGFNPSFEPSFGGRGRDDQRLNLMGERPSLSRPATQGSMDSMRPEHPSEDPSEKNGDVNGHKQTPPDQ